MPNTTLNKRIIFSSTRLPLAACFVLLLTAGFFYIANFGKGIAYAFCYTFLPAGAGALASFVFKKLRFVENIPCSSGKVKAIYLGFFTLHIFVLYLIKTADGFAPSLLILYIPIIYSIYVSFIPVGRAKMILCALFCAGVTALSFCRPTEYAGEGLIVIVVSLYVISIVAVRNDCFGCKSKLDKYATIIVTFSAVFLFLLLFSPAPLFFTTASIPANIVSVSIAEVIQNIGLVPALFVCTMYLAMAIFAFLHAVGKSNFSKHITASIVTVFALSIFMSFRGGTSRLPGNLGIPFLECTELSTAFILMFELILFYLYNKAFVQYRALYNIIPLHLSPPLHKKSMVSI